MLPSAQQLVRPEGKSQPRQGRATGCSGSQLPLPPAPPPRLTLRTSQGLLGRLLVSGSPALCSRVSHILNMAREIDNFYPERFIYHNVRLWDEESAQLLPHWKETHRFVEAARWAPQLHVSPCPRSADFALSSRTPSGRQGLPLLLCPGWTTAWPSPMMQGT